MNYDQALLKFHCGNDWLKLSKVEGQPALVYLVKNFGVLMNQKSSAAMCKVVYAYTMVY